MRIVWVAARPVYPPRGGSEIRVSGLIDEALDRHHQILLVEPDPVDPGAAPAGVDTIVARRSWTGPTKLLGKLPSRLPLHSPRFSRRSLDEVRDAVKAFGPDVILMSDLHSWPLTESIAELAPLVYDAHNLEADLMRQLRIKADGLHAIAYRIDEGRLRRVETRVVDQAIAILSVSDQDAAGLRRMGSTAQVVTAPSSVPLREVTADPSGAGPHMLFVGQLDYLPNTEAVRELVVDILPRVRAVVPEAELHLVGRRPPRWMREVSATTPHLFLHEDVPETEPYYLDARLSVMPIRQGSGSRLKVYESLSFGLPVVATETAVAGVGLRPGVDFMHAETAEGLAMSAATLLKDPSLAADLGRAGRNRFETDLTWARSGDLMEEALTYALIAFRQRGRQGA